MAVRMRVTSFIAVGRRGRRSRGDRGPPSPVARIASWPGRGQSGLLEVIRERCEGVGPPTGSTERELPAKARHRPESPNPFTIRGSDSNGEKTTMRPQAGAAQPLLDLEAVLAVRVDVLVAGRGEPG